MTLTESIASAISQATGQPFSASTCHGIGGGCINSAEVLGDGHRNYFVKLNDSSRIDMFEAELAGLNEIAESRSVRVPQPVVVGLHTGQSYLVLEYLDLGGHSNTSEDQLGRQLAVMHRNTRPMFGWWRDNTIGSTPQVNTDDADWIAFYGERRLHYQLQLAASHGGQYLMKRGMQLLDVLPVFFHSYQPVASLLHGDLWGGNHGALRDGTPVIFDPAVYYGDREADLAMTELFGGFGARFYAAYKEAWPLDPGYPVRKLLYNLYHILNHFNLFGGGYGRQAEHLINELLSTAR